MSVEAYLLNRSGDGGPGTVVRLPSGDELEPDRSLEIINHSPDGFQWGYRGSGPRQLALAVLLDYTDSRDFAKSAYIEFTNKVVSSINTNETLISKEMIRVFIKEYLRQEDTSFDKEQRDKLLP